MPHEVSKNGEKILLDQTDNNMRQEKGGDRPRNVLKIIRLDVKEWISLVVYKQFIFCLWDEPGIKSW